MVQYKPLSALPTEEDLPETDHRPVDNELQLLIPTLLRSTLALAWADRSDWFLGANLGIYYDPDETAICPDAFLVLGVPRYRPKGLRLSYVLWQEQYTVPLWVLEIVSQTPGSEYTEKMRKYAEMGVLYYTIYNPHHWRRDRHDPLEVYQLQSGQYVRRLGNPVWLPEIGLGIGVESGEQDGRTQDWLYWYHQEGDRYPVPEDIIRQQQQQAEQLSAQLQEAQDRAEAESRLNQDLIAKLRSHGINPDQL
ncbi:MAG: Uma2 family endonuclease [Thermosynechococcaceae cyanobacterium]